MEKFFARHARLTDALDWLKVLRPNILTDTELKAFAGIVRSVDTIVPKEIGEI